MSEGQDVLHTNIIHKDAKNVPETRFFCTQI